LLRSSIQRPGDAQLEPQHCGVQKSVKPRATNTLPDGKSVTVGYHARPE
jgi:hypothetical protein